MHIGERLRIEHGLSCQKGYMNDKGTFYNQIHYFPVALFDSNGYLVVSKEEELEHNPFRLGQKLHVAAPGISGHPRYKRCFGHSH